MTWALPLYPQNHHVKTVPSWAMFDRLSFSANIFFTFSTRFWHAFGSWMLSSEAEFKDGPVGVHGPSSTSAWNRNFCKVSATTKTHFHLEVSELSHGLPQLSVVIDDHDFKHSNPFEWRLRIPHGRNPHGHPHGHSPPWCPEVQFLSFVVFSGYILCLHLAVFRWHGVPPKT